MGLCAGGIPMSCGPKARHGTSLLWGPADLDHIQIGDLKEDSHLLASICLTSPRPFVALQEDNASHRKIIASPGNLVIFVAV